MFVYKIVTFLSVVSVLNAYLVLNLKNPTTKYGFVYPNRAEPNRNVTYVLEGVDVLIYLAKVPDNFAECKITTQDAEITFTLIPGSEEKSRVEFWTANSNSTNGCGARIKNVKVSDSGRWRLQAVNDENDHLYQSFINLKVIENFDRPDGNFVIREGQFDELNITKYATYCSISDPVLYENNKIFDQCQVELENINKLYAGKWKANVGVLGKIDEIILRPRVQVLGENFEVGFNKTGQKINLYCNLKNAVNVSSVTFCRFIKDGQESGLRLSEGLSNGKYSYYGHQIKDGDCGVTIEIPQSEDYGIWKCALGIYRIVNKTMEYEVKEAIISLSKRDTKRRNKREIEEYDTGSEIVLDEVLAGIENPLELKYQTDFKIKYCVIKHPNGTQYAINSNFRNDNWTTIGKLDVGECGMKIFNTSTNETGIWKMQIGHYDTYEMDRIIQIPVRVGINALVAVEKDFTPQDGDELTLKCKAVTERPSILEYCRFTLPDGTGFQIDKSVDEDNPIKDLYWYNGTSLEEGDCQVTIKKIRPEHYGQWKCSGKIKNSKQLEDSDTIDINDKGKLSIASISGIAVGAALLAVLIGAAFIFYRKKKRQQPQRRQTFLSSSSGSSHERNDPLVTTPPAEEIEMGALSGGRLSLPLPVRSASAPLASAETLTETEGIQEFSGPSTSSEARPSVSQSTTNF